jgi:LysR family nitrogen assimilation transcriptional regulator
VLTEAAAGTLDARLIIEPQISWRLCVASRADQTPKVAASVVMTAISEIVADLVARRIWQ